MTVAVLMGSNQMAAAQPIASAAHARAGNGPRPGNGSTPGLCACGRMTASAAIGSAMSRTSWPALRNAAAGSAGTPRRWPATIQAIRGRHVRARPTHIRVRNNLRASTGMIASKSVARWLMIMGHASRFMIPTIWMGTDAVLSITSDTAEIAAAALNRRV
jgi:hypothetical protein